MFVGKDRTRGQIVVVVALVMTVLLLFTALIVDGSNQYQQRRRCQNAVDSAAIAGLVEMRSSGTTNQKVHNVIVNYVTNHIGQPDQFVTRYVDSNNNQLNSVLSYGAPTSPPSTASGVYVWAQNKTNLYFGGFLGQTAKTSNASASAKGGALGSASGAFPAAVPLAALTGLTTGTEYRIWDDAKLSADSNTAPAIGGANGNRGWLNVEMNWNNNPTYQAGHTLDSANSASELANYVLGPNHGGLSSPPIYAGSILSGNPNSSSTGDFIQGNSGSKTNAVQAAASLIGDTVLIPIYDAYFNGGVMNSWVSSGTFVNGQEYLHIVGFASFKIDFVQSTGSNKYIRGAFQSRVVDGPSGGGVSTSYTMVTQSISLSR